MNGLFRFVDFLFIPLSPGNPYIQTSDDLEITPSLKIRGLQESYMKKMIIGITLISLMILTGCGTNTEIASRSLEELHKEQGIPVESRTLASENFSTYLSFTSTLTGIKESTGSAMLLDTIEHVLVEVGDFVEKDQIILTLPKSNPQANYYQSMAGFNAAEQAFHRIESLYASNGISRQNYDDAKTQYEVQLANWTMVQDMVEVKAPIAGYVTRLAVREADNVSPGQTLFSISNYDSLSSRVWVSDHEIRKINKGQKVSASWEGNTLQGTVTQVDLAQNPDKMAFGVNVLFDNMDHILPSGITAEIDIETSLNPNSIVLHRREILNDNQGMYVFINVDGTAQRVNIQPGLRQGLYYQIAEGLNPEDELITQGLTLLHDNSPIHLLQENESLALIPEN
ncbi:efflux RND transporter periplasmic adaptor subunit [Oceanispirochaeta sp. M1]|nr:efflux RND transporter periplasmic adaptor subunit [Oceanispirochaeta sp. M1]